MVIRTETVCLRRSATLVLIVLMELEILDAPDEWTQNTKKRKNRLFFVKKRGCVSIPSGGNVYIPVKCLEFLNSANVANRRGSSGRTSNPVAQEGSPSPR